MRTPGWMLIFVLIECCLLRPATASVYAYTGEDGTVTLSNVPADSRYQVIVADAPEHQVAAPPAVAHKPHPSLANKALYNHIVAAAANNYGLDGALLHAVISVESRYNPKAVSRKGAAGLMQLMPVIAKRYGVADSFDPVQNINGGAQYLYYLLKRFNGDLSLALAAYNAGEYAVIKCGNRIPPITETMGYVPKVLNYYHQYKVVL